MEVRLSSDGEKDTLNKFELTNASLYIGWSEGQWALITGHVK